MKTSRLIFPAGLSVSLALTGSHALAQGSLTPPGPPAPTMKTLSQVEPRIPISSAPYTISQPGSYYLTTNLTSTGHGVVITTDSVVLDLNGFSMTGDRDSTDYGLYVVGASNAPLRNIVVRNGCIANFGSGVRFDCALNSRIQDLCISSNSSYGVYLYGQSGQCNGNTIANCSISGNRGSGVYLNGRSGQCDGNTIANCSISGNGASGVYLNGYSSGQCDGNTIANCSISGNGNCGVFLFGTSGKCNGNTIADCSISGNSNYGVCLDGSFSGQCNGNTIADCSISGNGNYGVYLYGYSGQCDGNSIARCVIRNNTVYGIYLRYADGNRVEENHTTGTTGSPSYGIFSSSTTQNLILRNTCVGQTNNFSLSANDTYGPIVTNSGELATTGAAAHPWANFSR